MTDAELDAALLKFLAQQDATAHWLACRLSLTRERVSSRLRALKSRKLVLFDRVAWRMTGKKRVPIVRRM